MRVCFVTSQIAAWGKIGGFGVNTRRLGRALVERGVDVHVAVPRRRGQAIRSRLDGMSVHGLSMAEVFLGSDVYREIDADVYHVQEPNLGGYWAQRAMPGRVHLVTSMDPRDGDDWRIEKRYATWARRFKLPVQRFYEDGPLVQRSVRAADGVFVEAAFLSAKAQRLYGLPRPPACLPKAVDVPEGPFQKDLFPVCVFLGRFDPRKRPEIFFQLAERLPQVRFVAAGRAHDETQQRSLAKRYFHLKNLTVVSDLDPFDGTSLRRILEPAWVLVHPAAREGLPTAVQEASTHETAILAAVDPDGYVGRFGRVVPPGADLDVWERELVELLKSGEWREQGAEGRRYNLAEHSIDVSLRRHLATYESFLGGDAFRAA